MTNSNSGSLAARAILALILMIGFYLLALVIAGLLLFVIYLEFSSGHFNLYLTIICLFAAGVILWSIIPRPERFVEPGPALEPTKYPRLFAELKSISHAVGQEMPSKVYLLPEPNAFVSQVGGLLGLGSRRIMGIGLPLFSTLTVPQLRSVLAHEFGHYYGGDTKLGPWVYRTRIMVIRTVSGLRSNNTLMYLIRLPFYGYGKMFLRITLAISRRQEYNADKLAAQVVGAGNAIQALRTIRGVSDAWEAYWSNEFVPAFGSGFVPPLANGFVHFLEAKPVAQTISDILDQEMKGARTDPYDSHPSIKDRIAALEALPPGSPSTDVPFAISLIDDIPLLEMEILKPIAEKYHLPPLKAVAWNEITNLVYIPAWQKTVQEQEALLKILTPEKLSEVAHQTEMFESRLSGVDNYPAEQRTNLLYSAVGAALTLALWQRGWQINTAPGESIFASKDRRQIECFNILAQLRSSALSSVDWYKLCKDTGISGINLSQVTRNQTLS